MNSFKKNLNIMTAAGIAFTLILGTLLHFTFKWSGNSPVVGMFSAVNESVWEHLKLIAVPILLFAAAGFFTFGRKVPGFAPAYAAAALAGMLFITVFFCIYTAIFGRHFLIADIAGFVFAVIISFFLARSIIIKGKFTSPFAEQAGAAAIIILFALFIIFTFCPPHASIFKDPSTNGFGIPA